MIAYKRLFSRPRMVHDLLRGFAARDWSGDLDFASLTPLPASYVSHDLRQRHGDLVWRVRFKDDRWLYVVLLLEFQSAVDRSMAVRMLTYTGLLYQKLIADGVLREHGGLPPVLPVVIYNGRRPWTAPADVSALIASGGGAALARYQPSQRYFLLGVCAAGSSRNPGGLRRDARRHGVFRGRRAGDFRPAGGVNRKQAVHPPNAAIRTRFSVGGGRIHPFTPPSARAGAWRSPPSTPSPTRPAPAPVRAG